MYAFIIHENFCEEWIKLVIPIKLNRIESVMFSKFSIETHNTIISPCVSDDRFPLSHTSNPGDGPHAATPLSWGAASAIPQLISTSSLGSYCVAQRRCDCLHPRTPKTKYSTKSCYSISLSRRSSYAKSRETIFWEHWKIDPPEKGVRNFFFAYLLRVFFSRTPPRKKNRVAATQILASPPRAPKPSPPTRGAWLWKSIIFQWKVMIFRDFAPKNHDFWWFFIEKSWFFMILLSF